MLLKASVLILWQKKREYVNHEIQYHEIYIYIYIYIYI